jgi:Novel STAND NTPase 1/Sulfatase-modifying factor enzyme 1
MRPLNPLLRRHLIESIARLGPWQHEDTRLPLAADLTWALTAEDPAGHLGSPIEAAVYVVDRALAWEAEGADQHCGAMALGLPGLIEDLRELGGGDAGFDAWDSEPGTGLCRCWSERPYPGLLPLEHWQAPIYFGRRAETRALLRRLVDPAAPRFQVVTGMRGCGKSSLLGAGVRGWLGAGGLPRVPHAERWVVSALFPAGYGGDPFLALTHGLARALDAKPGAGGLDGPTEAALLKAEGPEALVRLCRRVLQGRPPTACWVLAVDELEELFGVVERGLADEFLEMLTGSLGETRLRVLTTVRADQLHQCCAHPSVIESLNHGGLFVLGPPSRASLERMIRGPLAALAPAGEIAIEPGLVERLLGDIEGAPDALFLLADALRELYARGAPGGCLTLGLDGYLGPWGSGDGLARRAERALAGAGEQRWSALGTLFSHLVQVRADGTATRRRADVQRIAQHPEAYRLAQSLAERDVGLVRLRQGERPTFELAHEALLHQWSELRRWSERHGEALRLRSRVERDARVWLASERSPERRWRHDVLASARLLLAETGVIEDLERDPDLADFLAEEPDWLLAELLCGALVPTRREEIGLRLAEIGDPRPGIGVGEDGTPAVEWCPVPPGEVCIEGHSIARVPAFRIAALPVTQAQIEAFLDAEDGFERPRWWQGLDRGAPLGRALTRRGNYPATQVSWCDAVAFCRWLSVRLGYPVRLPDEWEWQWAAQSAHPGFVYPWGRDWREGHANTEENALGRVAAVGFYPAGRSLQGVYDLAGNAWEWCRNPYARPRGALADPRVTRVLKGGSWRVNRGFARADFRLEGLPDDRMAGSGFRVVTTA